MNFDNQKWESLTKESILEKKPWFEVFREEIQLPDGKVIPEYYEIEMPHYTAVFAVTLEEKIIETPSVLKKKIHYLLLETIQIVVKALGIVKGPVHAEARINRNGNYILECASRSIGGFCSKVLEFQGGISLEELILRSYLGRNIEKSKLIGNARGVMMMPTEKMGML